jgi:hypothetical protein
MDKWEWSALRSKGHQFEYRRLDTRRTKGSVLHDTGSIPGSDFKILLFANGAGNNSPYHISIGKLVKRAKRPEREAEHSYQSSVDFLNGLRQVNLHVLEEGFVSYKNDILLNTERALILSRW